MFQTAWRKPVVVRLPKNIRIIRTAAEATDCLTVDWPIRHGNAYEAALRACIDCFEGYTTANETRIAFVAACREANALISA
ncbi:DUF982 domain-containing protein [Rhizobium leucaenae]|jgi:hypothetical protein|uniref:DUF982 domain-containing protein n=1 Tax=Rhizobium leucaenae TaxID=29450 RepID=A0A7W6ZPF6_9HYPH|nr:DUF982 domain-containing protein [Rhizobium leucaenae]MBB4566348.1 hypothetical protein [Rhizobium leucaenae]MBB6302671.1 hypothetical protein [Rhizobium leucaenae]